MSQRLASVSIDLDGLQHYEALHGLPHRSSPTAVAALAPSRLAALLAEQGAFGTFFAIGRETAEGPLRTLARAGHEIGNHTLDHRYDLTQLSPGEIERQIEGGADALAVATGVRPVGFRAPGYALSADVLRAAATSGHQYDSSVFPAAPYYLAKASMMGWLRWRGRPSAALLDRGRVLRAPADPYRPAWDEPYARGEHTVFELPIGVGPLTRLPFIGTLVVRSPWWLVRALYAEIRRRPFLNFELHGVDLLDPSDGISAPLAAAQPDLGISGLEKTRRLREVIRWIARDYQIVTLAQAATALRH